MSIILFHQGKLYSDKQALIYSCKDMARLPGRILRRGAKRDSVNKFIIDQKQTMVFGFGGDDLERFKLPEQRTKLFTEGRKFLNTYLKTTLAEKSISDIDNSKLRALIGNENGAIFMSSVGIFVFDTENSVPMFELEKTGTYAIGSRAISAMTALSLDKSIETAFYISACVDLLSSCLPNDEVAADYAGYDQIDLKELNTFGAKI